MVLTSFRVSILIPNVNSVNISSVKINSNIQVQPQNQYFNLANQGGQAHNQYLKLVSQGGHQTQIPMGLNPQQQQQPNVNNANISSVKINSNIQVQPPKLHTNTNSGQEFKPESVYKPG